MNYVIFYTHALHILRSCALLCCMLTFAKDDNVQSHIDCASLEDHIQWDIESVELCRDPLGERKKENRPQSHKETNSAPEKKDHTQPHKVCTFMPFMAADNNLSGFAARNLKQMANVGSNAQLNIVPQLDIRLTGNKKITRRYYIEKNQVLHVNAEDPLSQQMDSGDPETLISYCAWAIKHYPADHYILVLWNHGTGIIDPVRARIFNPAELFIFNPISNKLELDRSIEFLDFINQLNNDTVNLLLRGICWDDTTGNYLDNQKLDAALNEICTTYLNGKKFSIIAFDACLMSMLEVGNIVKKYAHIMVGSQEVELGTGWNYELVLDAMTRGTFQPEACAVNIVQAYKAAYDKVTDDYTQSAVYLDALDPLEKNVDTLAQLLLECIAHQKDNSVKKAIKESCKQSTHFDEPSYIDLYHFYTNLQTAFKYVALVKSTKSDDARKAIMLTLSEGKHLIKDIVFANVTGKNLKQAHGISIYFPEQRIHSSYAKTLFASSNTWPMFLKKYLS